MGRKKVEYQTILDECIPYIDNPDFANPKKRVEFCKDMPEFMQLHFLAKSRTTEILNMCEMPLLTRLQEQHLWRQYNCMKYEANQSKETLLYWQGRIKDIKDVLFMCNVKLLVQYLKKLRLTQDAFANKFSDCCIYLISAIDHFDYARGFKFSTYVTWAMRINFRRISISEKYYTEKAMLFDPSVLIRNFDKPIEIDPADKFCNKEQWIILEELMDDLKDKERFVLREWSKNQTLDAIGKDLSISKEGVRQIKLKALKHLRKRIQELV